MMNRYMDNTEVGTVVVMAYLGQPASHCAACYFCVLVLLLLLVVRCSIEALTHCTQQSGTD
jgi:hypothetical protein